MILRTRPAALGRGRSSRPPAATPLDWPHRDGHPRGDALAFQGDR
jgi:hypothetical protein